MSTPKKSAILVGCGYLGTTNQRYGFENDVKIIEQVLPTFGFRPENIRKLVETNNGPNQPTKANIQIALNNMKNQAGKGDVLLFYFSGLVSVDQSNKFPAIFSSDRQQIPAIDIQSVANQLPEKTNFTLLLESSHSGGFIDPVANQDKRILLSACQADEIAKRVLPDGDNGNAYGMFTQGIRKALNNHPNTAAPITNEELHGQVRAPIEPYDQHAVIVCSDNNLSAPFLGYL